MLMILISVAPTKRSLRGLLDQCLDFSTEYKVKFNPAKSNAIVFHNNTNKNQETSIIFDGQTIISKSQDVHIGNVIGQNALKCNVLNARNDIIRRVNVLISYFGAMNIDTKFKLFNIFCMNVYGSVLWDYSSHHVNCFYTAWRNSKYGIIKYDIVKSHRNEYLHVVNDFVVEFMSERAQSAGLLYDILCTRDDIYYNNYNLFSLDEVHIMIDHMCMN